MSYRISNLENKLNENIENLRVDIFLYNFKSKNRRGNYE